MNRKQNKGFTLVEVLIAMTILGIIVVPLLHAFVTSANTNAKSKRIMDATGLAQNIMEELKTGSLEDLARQFNGAEGEKVITLGDDLTTYVEESQTYNGTERVSVDGEDFIGQPSGNYNFLMQNIPVGDSVYDAIIELKASVSKDLASVYSMNQSDCGYYAQTENMDQRAAAEFQIRNAAYVYEAVAQKNTDEFKKMMKRTITISIEEHMVDVTYAYEIPRGYTADEDRTFQETTRIYHDLTGEQRLKAVYLYYYPLYSNRGDAESIVINNEKDLDVDVFLVKMDEETESEGLLRATPTLEAKTTGTGSSVKVNSNDTFMLLTDNIQFTNNFSNKETVTSLYDVTIEVYRFQSDSALAFSEADLIDSYTGSFLDDSEIIR